MLSRKQLWFGACALFSTFVGNCEASFVNSPHHHHHHHHRHLLRDLDSEIFTIAEEPFAEEHHAKRGVNVFFSSTYPATAAQATAINIPTPVSTTMLGNIGHSPATQYLAVATQALPTLTSDMLVQQINPELTDDFIMWNGSGTVSINTGNEGLLHPLMTTPSYSRDQGKGGTVNGYHIFVFADTNTYTAPSVNASGNFTGAVSNSAAVDVGLRAANGSAPMLRDMMGSMKGPKGPLRGFIPWTQGEAAYNSQNAGGSRYAIWPMSSLIPLNPTTSLLYAPIIFQNISGGALTFTSAGVTLCEITVPSLGGPVADRVSPLLFTASEVQFGAIGGVRSYGPSGVQGGQVYIFGKVKTGLLLGRVASYLVTDVNSYQWYYPGIGWNSTMPTRSATSCFANGTFSAVDVFYSPRHLTFIMVFMDNYADNRIQWKYLVAPPILPTYAGGNMSDIAGYLTMYKWSQPQILIQIPTPPSSYAYGGGLQLGYFGPDDVSRGGTKMLLSWTWPNGEAAAGMDTGYSIQTAVVTWT